MTEKKRMKMYEQANALIFNYPGQLTLEQTKYLNTRCCETYTAAHNDATAIIEKLERALSGIHANCEYLSYGVCNKCGTFVNNEALAELNKWRDQ